MKKIYGGIMLLLFAFASGTMAIPKPKPEPAPEKTVVEKKEEISGVANNTVVAKKETFSGVIEKVDTRRNAVVVRDILKKEKTLTFVVSNKTKIRKSAIPLLLKDVKRAMQVTVEYLEEKDRLSALSIEVHGP